MAPDPELERLARVHCLHNAIQHGGQAQPKGLTGRILGSHPEYRKDPKAVLAALTAAAEEVNALGADAQREALAAEAPELLEERPKERPTGLRPLPDAVGKVVLRFAPNPNGPLSLGHARGLSLLSEYANLHDGELVLRFDDTDPQVKPPLMDAARGWDGYAMVREDVHWLTGRHAHREILASNRIRIYHDAARDLIRAGGAYTCTCTRDDFHHRRRTGQACSHRDEEPEAHRERFDAMVAGDVAAGSMVLRVKTDMAHPDPALRDWTAFRVVAEDAHHPRAAAGEIPDHRCWPLLDFESAVEDHLQGVTHVIRGKDLMDSTKKQTYLYQHMGWDYPRTHYWGRVRLHGFGRFSTSWMRERIEAGDFTGWDDPRLPTLAALRRRGYHPEAVRSFWIALGRTEKDIAVSMENLEAEDAKRIDDATPRYFFVPDARPLSLTGAEGHTARVPIHPNHPERGHREIPAGATIHLPDADARHPRVRLKDLGNIVIAGGTAFFSGSEMDRSIPIVQWLPRGHAEPFTVLRPGTPPEEPAGDDGTATDRQRIPPLEEVHGLVEPAALEQVGRVVQFERFGFVRIETPELGVWLHG